MKPFIVGGLMFHGDDLVVAFTEQHGIPRPRLPFVSVGIVERGAVTAGAYFTNWLPGQDITITVACHGAGLSTAKRFGTFYKWAFEHFGVPRITAHIEEANTRSRKLAERVGFVPEGTKRKAAKNGGNVIVYGLLKEDMTLHG